MTDMTRRASIALAVAAAGSPARAADAKTVLITGSNRGLGLEFAKQYAALGWNVIATTRTPAEAEMLNKIAAANKNVTVEALDVTKFDTIDALAAKYKDKPIDLLINNAGIVNDFIQPKPQSFGTLDYSLADRFMNTNAIGALKVTEAFYENVKSSQMKKIVAVTSLAGSFGVKFGGVPGGYWYKISKAALNAAMVNVSVDAKKDGVIVALLSPGQVRVEKIAMYKIPGMIETPESISGMIAVIDKLTMEDAGTITRYTGEKQPV
jgi:NAD(P)-dependent dehydrogenase (short-subunit alcohol dehydrogenase family)